MNESKAENGGLEISKSQRKREAQALLDLAKKLLAMPEARLRELPLDAELLDEVRFARGIRAHGARKRQLMTIGKLLRKRDNAALLDAVDRLDGKRRQQIARFHHIEAWRDRLLEGTDKELSELLAQTGAGNAQGLRQSVRNAQKEISRGKPPAAARKLFRMLREMDDLYTLPPLP